MKMADEPVSTICPSSARQISTRHGLSNVCIPSCPTADSAIQSIPVPSRSPSLNSFFCPLTFPSSAIPRPQSPQPPAPPAIAHTSSTFSQNGASISIRPGAPTPCIPSRRTRMTMGPRADCEKCRMKIPGHWMHVDQHL